MPPAVYVVVGAVVAVVVTGYAVKEVRYTSWLQLLPLTGPHLIPSVRVRSTYRSNDS